jgi:O-antigen ligase
MTPAVATIATTEDPVQKAGFSLLCLYFFLLYSRVLDVTVPSLHLPLIVGLGLYGTAALAGSIQRAIVTTAGQLLVGLTGIMVLAAVFGAWRGGSIELLSDKWLKAFPLYFTIVGLCLTTTRIFRFLHVISWALGILAVIALWRGDNLLGRLMVDGSRFADPNDLALVCLIGLPITFFFMRQQVSFFSRIPIMGIFLVLLYAMSKTGSRGAVLGLAAGIAYVFWKASMIGKFKMTVVVFAVLFISAAILPPEVYLRYAGVDSNSAEMTDEAVAAEGSADARLHLLKESLVMTLMHPLLGVGPGNFAVVENDVAQAKGFRRGSWHDTHNMYTQVSSENGIPAGLLYIAILVLALRATKRTVKIAKQHPNAESVAKAALCLRIGLFMFAVCGGFLSVAYSDILPLMSGLAISLELAVLNEIKLRAKSIPTPVPALTPVFAGMRR